MKENPTQLDKLHARSDAIALSRNGTGGSADAHAAVLERLAANRRGAEAGGWTALELERDGGLGRLRLLGLAPGHQHRSEVPDPA